MRTLLVQAIARQHTVLVRVSNMLAHSRCMQRQVVRVGVEASELVVVQQRHGHIASFTCILWSR